MLNARFRVRARVVAVAAAAVSLAACASGPPEIPQGPGVETTFDGLVEVRNSRADRAWVRQDIDLSSYSKVMLVNAGIEYRPAKATGTSYTRRSQTEFPVSEEARTRFRALVDETVAEEMAKSERFEVVTEPGEDVLLIRGALLDVVSFVPPDTVGRSDVYLDAVGEVTLVLEIRDSLSNAVLARAVDRRSAERVGGNLQKSNRVTNTAEVRRLIRYWARLLRTRLDEVAR